MFSKFNPSKCTHTWSSGQPTLRRPVSSWGFGALLKGLTSVMDNSCRSRDSNPQPQVTSLMLYPLGHDCPWPDFNASSVSPGTGLCLCYFSALCFTKLQSFSHSFFPKTIWDPPVESCWGRGPGRAKPLWFECDWTFPFSHKEKHSWGHGIHYPAYTVVLSISGKCLVGHSFFQIHPWKKS